LRTDLFNIVVECGFFKPLVRNADSAKPPQGPGIGDMKSQIYMG
jgi:hypothetical protein